MRYVYVKHGTNTCALFTFVVCLIVCLFLYTFLSDFNTENNNITSEVVENSVYLQYNEQQRPIKHQRAIQSGF